MSVQKIAGRATKVRDLCAWEYGIDLLGLSMMCRHFSRILKSGLTSERHSRSIHTRCHQTWAPLTIFTRLMATSIATLFEMRIASMEKYLQKLDSKMHPSSLNYWRQFGNCSLGSIQSRSEARRSATGSAPQVLLPLMEINSYKGSLYVFPGRTRRRHGIYFDKLDRKECTKNYFKGNSQIPSFMIVQCCCAKPKLLGFVILKQCESLSAAISSVLTHFNIPPGEFGTTTPVMLMKVRCRE